MKKHLCAVKNGKRHEKVKNITEFYGIDRSKLADGVLLDAENVTVLSSGALNSVLCEKRIDVSVGSAASLEGVYSYCEDFDPRYEIHTTHEWVYENICPESVLAYESWQKPGSRLMIRDVGLPAKTENGYRNIISAFSSGDNTYVFYDACYNMLDERRQAELAAVGSGLVWTFYSGRDGTYTGSIKIYRLTQVFLDVIDVGGNVTTALVDARLVHLDTVGLTKYNYSVMVSADKQNYRYVSSDYQPNLGEFYNAYPDAVYEDFYKTLGTDYTFGYSVAQSKKRVARYCNSNSGVGAFDSAGEKVLLLPDMRLLYKSAGKWTLTAEKSATMPTMSAAVQQYDRLYGIYNDTLYVSVKGDCTDFTPATDNQPSSGGWRMVTTDESGFTAIAAFDGKVAVFTSSTLMTVRGNDLPFSLSHAADCGCYGQDALAVCDGSLYFVSENGIMCYSGSSIKCISDALPFDTEYSLVKLGTACGVLTVSLGDRGQLWFYEPSSDSWSRFSLKGDLFVLVGRSVFVKNDDKYELYSLFEKFGDFTFSLGLGNAGRRAIKSITLTARTGIGSEICLSDSSGRQLMCLYDAEYPVSRTYRCRGMYTDCGRIMFSGYGDVTLYGIRIEYDSVNVRRME